MGLRLSHTTFDATDPYTIAEFWRELLSWEVQDHDIYKPGSDECSLVSEHGYTVLFFRSPDRKTVKNRAHLDLVPRGAATQEGELHRALEMGATLLDDRRHDLGWIIMADPEGNEFCILNQS